ncbi:MAG TPA: VWA domain-containing protein [Candidatus Acidoferrales bacterium]|nr:VWA domain-containing protein [Candidatus Acidoferrales bacterium]
MSLFFLHPVYLYGLIAASLPILIHLLNRRRIRTIRFPAVRFILLSQRRISRTYRLRHWLLLALRTLAIAFLVLLLANPIFQTGIGLLAAGGPAAIAIVLDNSLSMKWSLDGNGFELAKQSLERLISELGEGDRAAIIPTNPPRRTQPRLRAQKELLRKELAEVQLSAETADFAAALQRAYHLLREPAAHKEIWLATDLAVTGWERFEARRLKSYDPLTPVKILKIPAPHSRANATVRDVALKSAGVAAGLPLQLEARLVNFGPAPVQDALAQLALDGRSVEQRLVSIPPYGETSVAFQLSLKKPGTQAGAVSIKKEGLAGNATVHFVLHALDKLRVLVVDGDPQTALVLSESFFLTRSLNPAGDDESSLFLPTVILPEALASARLEDYQVLILCNVPAIPEAVARKMSDYLRQGGGVLVFAGNRVDKDDYNLKLFQKAPLLPARLGEKRSLDGKGEKVGRVDSRHPALGAFAEPIALASLQSTFVQSYLRAEVAGGTVLAALANGEPLLLEKRIGPGRLILVTTSADRDWTDLPMKTAYLPLVQGLARYLSGDKTGSFDPGIVTGSAKGVALPPSLVGKRIKAIKPDNKEIEVTAVAEKEAARAVFDENDLAGVYRLAFSPADKPAGVPEMYAVNPPYLESRLETLSEKDLAARLEPVRAEIIPIEELKKGGTRVDLSLPLAFLLILTLASESWLAQRFSS